MGGHPGGELVNAEKDIPFGTCTDKLLDYSLFTASFHFGEMIMHIKNRRGKSGFEEFLLHHIATCALYFGFTFANFFGTGATIAWMCDIADIFGSLSKMGSGTTYTKSTVGVFLITMVAWFITRICWLPYLIYYIQFENKGYPEHLKHFNVFIELNVIYLLALFVLNVMWFCYFIQMITTYAEDGTTEDIQEGPDEDANKKKNQ